MVGSREALKNIDHPGECWTARRDISGANDKVT